MSQKLRQAADGPLPLVTPTSTQDGIQDPYSQLPPLIRVRGLAPLELLASEDDLQFSACEFKFPPHPCKQLCNLGLRLLSWIPSRFADDRSKFIETETEYPIWLNILRAALKYAYTITPALGGSPYLQPITHRVNMCMILASFIPVSCVNRTSGNALQDLIVSTINYYRLYSTATSAGTNRSVVSQLPVLNTKQSPAAGKPVTHPASQPTTSQRNETTSTNNEQPTVKNAQVDIQDKPVAKVGAPGTQARESKSDKPEKMSKKAKKEARKAKERNQIAPSHTANDESTRKSPLNKKRKHRGEDEEDHDKKGKKRKRQDSDGAADKASVSTPLAQHPSQKEPKSTVPPEPAPPRKRSTSVVSISSEEPPALSARTQKVIEDVCASHRGGTKTSEANAAHAAALTSSHDSRAHRSTRGPVAKKTPARAWYVPDPTIRDITPEVDSDSDDDGVYHVNTSNIMAQLRGVQGHLVQVPVRPKPTIDPAAQSKEGRVYTAKVHETMLQKEIDRNGFLIALLKECGVTERQADEIEVRVNRYHDSMSNAYRAVVFRKPRSG